MRRLRQLLHDRTGSSAIEFAVSVPVLVSIIWGIFQVGILYMANAGMQHALGQAARYATLFPTPSDAEIEEMITSTKFGVGNGTWGDPDVSLTDTATMTKTITVTYSQPMQFLFFEGPTVDLSASKVIYLAT